jgi:hypothetical protein
MGFLDRLLGSDEPDRQAPPVPQGGSAAQGRPSTQPPRSDDEIAIERYRYLLRTAPPETIEQVHAEAFAKLTDAQRREVLAELSATLPEYERPASADPQAMARAATRAEYTQPGFMERTLGPQRQGGPSFGSMLGSSILGTVVGYVIGSALVSAFLAPSMADGDSGDGSGDAAQEESTDASADGSADSGEAGSGDGWGDSGSGWGGDTGGADAGGDFGGFGGDFGGDFGF